jgi:hypothetical protein
MSAQVINRTEKEFTIQISVPYNRSMLDFEETLQQQLNAAGVLANQEGSCQFCAHGGVGRDFLKSASALRVSGDGNAGGAPLWGSCTRRLAPFAPTVSVEASPRLPILKFSTALRFTHSALEGSDQ